MELQDFAPIFGEPTRVEWVNRGSLSLHQFLFHVYTPSPSQLRFLVTDFHSNTWESTKSAFQLEDMVGIFDFSLYVVSLLHPSSLISINMLFLLLFPSYQVMKWDCFLEFFGAKSSIVLCNL